VPAKTYFFSKFAVKTPGFPAFARESLFGCTKFGHLAVDGLHSIENAILTNLYFSLTPEIEGVKTQSFFDSFLSFSGWCGVRGSSEVTFLTAR
jgi:hypothetical protein